MKIQRLLRSLATVALFAASLSCSHAAAPAWWAERGVLTTGATANDYAAINLGQVKRIASLACDELQAKLPGGAGSAINGLVDSWSQAPGTGVIRNDYAAVNHGQLKALAKVFYDRLAEVGYQGAPLTSGQTYPWTATTADDNNYAAANIGQVKQLFSFDLTYSTASYGNNLDFEQGGTGWTSTGAGGQIASAMFDSRAPAEGTMAYQSATGSGSPPSNVSSPTNTLQSAPFILPAGTFRLSAQLTGGASTSDANATKYLVLLNASNSTEIARLRRTSSNYEWELRVNTFTLSAATNVYVKIVDTDNDVNYNYAHIGVDDIRVERLSSNFTNLDFEQGTAGWLPLGSGSQVGTGVSDGQSPSQGSRAYQSAPGTGAVSSSDAALVNQYWSGTFLVPAGDHLFSGDLFAGASSSLSVTLVVAATGFELCTISKWNAGDTWERRGATFTVAADTLVYVKIVDDTSSGYFAVDDLTVTAYTFNNFNFEEGWVGWTTTASFGEIEPHVAGGSPYQGTRAYQSARGATAPLPTAETQRTNVLTSYPFTVSAGTVRFSAQLYVGQDFPTHHKYVALVDASSGSELARLARSASGYYWEQKVFTLTLATDTIVRLKIVDEDDQVGYNYGFLGVDDIRVETLAANFTNLDFEQGSAGWRPLGSGSQVGTGVSDGQSPSQGSKAYQSAPGTGTVSSSDAALGNEYWSGTFLVSTGDHLFSGDLFAGASSSLTVTLVAAATGAPLCSISKWNAGATWERRGATFTVAADTLVYVKIVDDSSGYFAVDDLTVTAYTFNNFNFEEGWVGWITSGTSNQIDTTVANGGSPPQGQRAYQSALGAGAPPTQTAATNTLQSLPFNLAAGTHEFSAYLAGGGASTKYVAIQNVDTGSEITRLQRSGNGYFWQPRSASFTLAADTLVRLKIFDNDATTNFSYAYLGVDGIVITP